MSSLCEHTKNVCVCVAYTHRHLECGRPKLGRPPLVDADWHAFFQAIFQGVEGPEWEATCHHYKDLHQAVKCKKPGENTKAKVLWTMNEAKDRGQDHCDPGHQKELQTRDQFRLNLWAIIHLKSPTTALAKALECLEQSRRAPAATCEW